MLMIMMVSLLMLSSCAKQEMIDRSFTYFNEDGKYYVEVNVLELDDDQSILTVTVKWTPTRPIQYTLSTSAYGKAGLLSVEINEKISRNILFSIYPFTMDEAVIFPIWFLCLIALQQGSTCHSNNDFCFYQSTRCL
jgi:hypothetical protein